MTDPLSLLAELAATVEILSARVDELESESARSLARRWLTVDETAAYLGATPKAIRGRISRGDLPTVRDGGRVYVDRHRLDADLAAKLETSTRPADRGTLRMTTNQAPARLEPPGARTHGR